MARIKRVKLPTTAWYHLIARVTNQDFLLETDGKKSHLWSRAFRLGSSGAEAPSSNRACGFPAHGFPCETGVIGISFS